MAKRSKKKKTSGNSAWPMAPAPVTKESLPKSIFWELFSGVGLPLLLAVMAFLVYWPSLKSDFVYDARFEIFGEGFITNSSNLPEVLSLHVLGMNLMLGDRPGQLLYLMLIAAVCGKEPFGYHLCSNLIHAANVALLFVLLRRLAKAEIMDLTRNQMRRVQLAAATVTLIFALHPLAVEPVAAINYSSDLLVAFFTLLALLAATAFRPENFRVAMLAGIIGTLCAFAAVTCKESGLAAAGLLIVYWILFRRDEAKGPWFWFLGGALTVTVAFLAARFVLAPHLSGPSPTYLGGSFFQVFLPQSQLWVFMMGKLFWPVQLSADYTLENLSGISVPFALAIAIIVILLQVVLAAKSRLGAMGVAIYWLGLSTVSNFIPLNRILADRFYYLPLIGVAMQLLPLLLLTLKSRCGFWVALAPFLSALLPLTALTFARQDIFANEFSLWSDTIQVSPLSSVAHNNLGIALSQKGQVDEGIIQFQNALEIDPTYALAHSNLGNALVQRGRVDEAIFQFQKALELNPYLFQADNSLGNALLQKGRVDEAMFQFQKALELNPRLAETYNNLGHALSLKGQVDEAMALLKKSLEINPYDAKTHCNLGVIFSEKGQLDEAITQFQKALEINPNFPLAHNDLGKALLRKGQVDEAIAQFQEVVRLEPNDGNAQMNLAKVQAMARQKSGQK